MTEAQLTTKIMGALNRRGAMVVKIHGGPHQIRGLPDIVGCYEGWFFGLEVKKPGKEKTLTRLQAHALAEIERHGGESAVVTSPNAAIRFLETRFS